MGWWNPPAWISDLAGWWRAVREVDPALAGPKEISVPDNTPPTLFLEVKPADPPPDGSRCGGWQKVVLCKCGWMPEIELFVNKTLIQKNKVFSWEPCPGCGEKGRLFETSGRPWCNAEVSRFWWEFKRRR